MVKSKRSSLKLSSRKQSKYKQQKQQQTQKSKTKQNNTVHTENEVRPQRRFGQKVRKRIRHLKKLKDMENIELKT